jgi:hypothetical protein
MTKDKGNGKDDGGRRDSRRVFGGISGRAGNAPVNRGAGRGKDTIRPPETAPRPWFGKRGDQGNSN